MPTDPLSDTDLRTQEVYYGLLRSMTPEQRIARVFELCEFQRSLQIASVRSMYPDADEDEVRMRVAARILPRDLMIKAYGWDPDEHT